MWSRVEDVLHRASRTFSFFSLVSLILMMSFVGLDVGSGYLFRAPIPGSIDFVILMMVILIFPSLPYAAQLDAHVRTDIFYGKLSRRGKGICNTLTASIGVFVVGLMAWRLGLRVWISLTEPPGPATPYFNWPQWPFMFLGFLGLSLMGMELLAQLVHAVRDAKIWRHSSERAETERRDCG